MSVHRTGGSSSSSLSYSDHDVHHVSHVLKWSDNADSGPDDSVRDTRQFEITSRGIDPDELAELRAMRVQLTLGTDDSPVAQDEAGAVIAGFETGFNLSGDEFLFADRAQTGIDTDSSGTTDFQSIVNDTDEVGQLTADRLSMYVGYSDTTDGTGGAAGAPTMTYFLNCAELFGSGPYVDAADDFVTSITMDVNNLVAACTAEANLSLYYNVTEVEGGRTRFGR